MIAVPSGELISICEPSCHGVCIMKWSKSVSFIRVGHFYTVNCLNLVGLPFNIVSANQGPVNNIRRASDRPMTRRIDDAIVSLHYYARNRVSNWYNFRSGVKDGSRVNEVELLELSCKLLRIFMSKFIVLFLIWEIILSHRHYK